MAKNDEITPKIELTNGITYELAKVFERRCTTLMLKGKKKLNEQAAFFAGVVALADFINDAELTNKSSISPMIYFSIMRGGSVHDECKKLVEPQIRAAEKNARMRYAEDSERRTFSAMQGGTGD